MEHEHNSPKVNMWCAVKNSIMGPSFFGKCTVTGSDGGHCFVSFCRNGFLKGDALPHFFCGVHALLDG
jgi:hypothetical protein